MLPFPIGSLEPTYQAFKSYYISKYGSNKFEEIYDKISTSPTIIAFFNESIQRKFAPAGSDFADMIFSLRYFIFVKMETRAMGGLIELKIWNEIVNKNYNLSSPDSVDLKVEMLFKRFALY